MRFEQYDDYPFCGRYLANFLAPDILKRQHPDVWDAFRKVCGSDDLATQGLSQTKEPLVTITDLECGTNGEYRGRNGGPKNTVFVNKITAAQYEKGTNWLIYECTVLHETVHWARFVGGLESQYNGEEAGLAFERLAYGRVINCGCFSCK
jgi:hypothetical protein